MEITAAVLNGPAKPFDIEKIELDTSLQPDEVLVRIVATGLCHTDISIRDQNLPFGFPSVLGHEGAGIVEQTGTGITKVKVGDSVVLAPASCGKCDFCISGHPSYCTNFLPLNLAGHRANGSHAHHKHNGNDISDFFFGQSSFATYAIASESNLVKVQDDVPLEMLGPLGCGLQTGAGTVMNVLKPGPGESIAVFGIGPVGLAGIMAAKAAGCTTIIAVDIHENRLQLAKELGATHIINSRNVQVSDVILKDIHPVGVHYSLDTTGNNNVITQAVASLRYMGKCAAVGVSKSPKLEIDSSAFSLGRSVEFVIEGDSVPDILIPKLISLYKQGLFPFDRLIKFYNLDEINQAVEDSEKGITLKAVIRMPH